MTDLANTYFKHLRNHNIESLNITVEEYEHIATGASHIHLSADSDENVFLVALRTVPEDSTGVAHILEHTALCGSKKYPVRDPFFMMIRRSLNTFMNAFTSSDWTAYPFASLNKKDFDNLLDVYLDAVFFSRLDPMDFAQEGHRLEFEQPNDSNSALVFKGVVFNEMKGAMSSVPSQLWQSLCSYLYPTTTYHHNSGGDPQHITDLSYEQLLAFYRTHYHPSNAIFMTFGNIPAAELQLKFQHQALARFDKLDEIIAVPDEKRYLAPLRVEEYYPYTPADEGDDTSENGPATKKSHIVMAWLLGKSTDLKATLEAHLLNSVLLDHSASPLQHVLETSELGTAPSPLCGLDDSQHELTFVCGVEGSEPEHAAAVEKLILSTLEKVATEGVPMEDVEASLHQLELQQREIGGDSYPYGLQLILTALTAATHRGDPIGLLDIDPVLAELRQAIRNPDYIKSLVKDLLLRNQHRVRLSMIPDPQLAQRKVLAETQLLQSIKAHLTDTEKQHIIEQAAQLQERQRRKDDDSILPKVTLDDIPRAMRYVAGSKSVDKFPITQYGVGTNGLSYTQAVLALPQLSEDELEILPLLTLCLTELGINDADYLATQRRQSQFVGSINGFTSIRGNVDDAQLSQGNLVLSAKALVRNHKAMVELLRDTLYRVRFDEHSRIRELVAQARARKEQSVTGSGHGLAMAAAVAGMSPIAQLQHRLSGLAGIKSIKQLDNSLAQAGNIEQLANRIAALHQRLTANSPQFLLVAEDGTLDAMRQELLGVWPTPKQIAPADSNLAFALPTVKQPRIAEAWLTGTQVNFCAKAYPTVPMTHPDAPALTVLGGFLRNGYLHRAIREQGGAYGSGAQQDSNIAAFKFFSYRDPRLTATLQDFDAAIDWLLEEEHEWQQVEEAILGTISSIDKPGSPAGEAKQAFHAELHGRDRARREAYRNGVLQVTLEDLQRVGRTYLKDTAASVAVVTNKDNLAAVEELSLTPVNL